MHHSGALLLEACDGEFLDEQLRCSSIAASTHAQQPDQCTGAGPHAHSNAMDEAQAGNDGKYDGPEAYSHNADDGAVGDDWAVEDAGDDYMQQQPTDLDHAGMPGQHCSRQHALQWYLT